MRPTRSAGITPRNTVAIESGRLMRDLQEARPLKTAFVATLSHQIRTPLANIAGYGEMLADGAMEPYSPQWNDVIGRIQRSVRELLDPVGVALDLVQLKAGEKVAGSAPPGREAGPLAHARRRHGQQ
jgi:signal transduction histidine kinase